MGCSGECTKTETQIISLDIAKKYKVSNVECPKLDPKVAKAEVMRYLGTVFQDVYNGCPDCDCELVGKPRKGPKRTYNKSIKYVKADRLGNKCIYLISFTVVIRKLLYEGICYEKSLPDLKVVARIEEADEETPMIFVQDDDGRESGSDKIELNGRSF